MLFPYDFQQKLKQIIKVDSLFLSNFNLMDYSLLLGIEYVPLNKRKQKEALGRNCFESSTRVDPQTGEKYT